MKKQMTKYKESDMVVLYDSKNRRATMIKILFNFIFCVLFAFLVYVCYLCFSTDMSFKQATTSTLNSITHIASRAKSNAPDYMKHTPGQAADDRTKRIADQLN